MLYLLVDISIPRAKINVMNLITWHLTLSLFLLFHFSPYLGLLYKLVCICIDLILSHTYQRERGKETFILIKCLLNRMEISTDLDAFSICKLADDAEHVTLE